MISKKEQIIIWILLLGFWIIFSRSYHPTFLINVAVTTILLSAYAAEIYLNFLFILPRFWKAQKHFLYWIILIISSGIFTFVALASIRAVYSSFVGAEQLGDYWQNYFIDFLGMIIHLLGAIAFVAITKKIRANPV